MSDVKKTVHKLIRETINLDPSVIDPNTPWYDLGVESFDLVELIIALRQNFQVALTTNDLSNIDTLDHLIQFIEQNVKEKPRPSQRRNRGFSLAGEDSD